MKCVNKKTSGKRWLRSTQGPGSTTIDTVGGAPKRRVLFSWPYGVTFTVTVAEKKWVKSSNG